MAHNRSNERQKQSQMITGGTISFAKSREVFMLRWYYIDHLSNKIWATKSIPRTVKTEGEAEQFKAAFLKQMGETQSIPTNNNITLPPLTLRMLADQWLTHMEANPKVARATYRLHKGNTHNYILKHTIADVAINDISIYDAAKFIGDIVGVRTKQLGSRSIRNVLVTATCFMKDIRNQQWANVMTNVFKDEVVKERLPKQQAKYGNNIKPHLELVEVAKLLNCPTIPQVRRMRYAIAFFTGMRDNEINALRWKDIDFVNGTLEVDHQLDKAGKEPKFRQCKAHSERTLPIHSTLLAMLKQYHSIHWAANASRMPTLNDAVLTLPDTDHFDAIKRVEYLRNDMARAGVNTMYKAKTLHTFHGFRRSFATHLTDANAPTAHVSQLLGHSSGGTSDRYYIQRKLGAFALTLELLRLPDIA
jgi:integrase